VTHADSDDDDDDGGPPGDGGEGAAAAAEAAADDAELKLVVDEHTTALLAGYHARVVLVHAPRQMVVDGRLWGWLAAAPGGGRSGGGGSDGGLLAARRAEADVALLRCRLLAARAGGLDWGLRGLLVPALGGALRGGALAALATLADHCAGGSGGGGGGGGGGTGGGDGSQWLRDLAALGPAAPANARGKAGRAAAAAAVGACEVDRDLLLLLAPTVEGFWRPRDFHADPYPEGIPPFPLIPFPLPTLRVTSPRGRTVTQPHFPRALFPRLQRRCWRRGP